MTLLPACSPVAMEALDSSHPAHPDAESGEVHSSKTLEILTSDDGAEAQPRRAAPHNHSAMHGAQASSASAHEGSRHAH